MQEEQSQIDTCRLVRQCTSVDFKVARRRHTGLPQDVPGLWIGLKAAAFSWKKAGSSYYKGTDREVAEVLTQGRGELTLVPERRQAERYMMELPVQLMLDGGMQSSGTTRDVSAGGIYVHVKRRFEVLNNPAFLITFPKEVTMSCGLFAFCNGTVVRRDENDDTAGLAIRIDRFQFLRAIY